MQLDQLTTYLHEISIRVYPDRKCKSWISYTDSVRVRINGLRWQQPHSVTILVNKHSID